MPEWLKRTPPHWLRHFIPLRLLAWLNPHIPWCWVSVVTWKLGYGAMSESWWPKRVCFAAWPERYDYCGKFTAEQEDAVVGTEVIIRFAQ